MRPPTSLPSRDHAAVQPRHLGRGPWATSTVVPARAVVQRVGDSQKLVAGLDAGDHVGQHGALAVITGERALPDVLPLARRHLLLPGLAQPLHGHCVSSCATAPSICSTKALVGSSGSSSGITPYSAS